MQPHEMKPSELAQAIRDFVEKHARISPNYDPTDRWSDPEERFTGPDPSCLLAAAASIERGEKPDRVFSDWGSGCYGEWNDKALQAEHDALVKAAYAVTFDAEDKPATGPKT